MNPLTVNQAIEQLEHLNAKEVSIQGMLSLDFEGTAIYHTPSAERREGESSSIWLFAQGSPSFVGQTQRWDRRVVIVRGVLRKADPKVGCGHMGLWPAEMHVTSISRP